MSNPGVEQVTRILNAAAGGDAEAADELLPIVYEELRALARAHMAGERVGHTLQPTALVHEAFLRLFPGQDVQWSSRAHFFGAAALAMRRVLVDQARQRGRKKRGGGRERVPLDDAEPRVEPTEDLTALDESLDRLAALDARKSEVVMLRFFGGLSVPETARVLGVSPATVKSEWSFARAWLYEDMTRDDGDPGEG